MTRKLLAIFLCFVLAASALPARVTASEESLEIIHGSTALAQDDAEPEDLFAKYAQQVFYCGDISLLGTYAGDTLTGNERILYDALVPLFREIAAGERASTILAVGTPVTAQGGVYYPVDVEVSFVDRTFTDDALDRVIGALLADMPYELYWYDKVMGCNMFYFQNSRKILQFDLLFYVSDNYQGAKEFTVDTAKAGAPSAAAAYAKSIAASFASSSDYEKLTGYKDTICSLTDYSFDAIDTSFSSENDAWQLIYVFDQNPDTKVVCEGYSKAFQYLCDLTVFDSDVACRTVSGYLNGGGHMWNIVTLGGKNYLADVTNSDHGSFGDDGGLFLAGASGNAASGYLLKNTFYSYDHITALLWGTGEDSILTLSETDYAPDVQTGKVVRVFGADRYATAFQSADAFREVSGTDKFSSIIVACGTNFPDALAGTYLAAKKNAPILLVKGSNVSQVNAYIQDNLAPGGTLYLLGDNGVVPDSVGQGIGGIAVKRLGGATRYDTNLLILKEAGVGNEAIIVCTGQNFADSLSASAVGLPILLVKDGLTAAQEEFLAATSGEKIIIGGTGAVSQNVENALKAYGSVRRIGGSNRYETSVLVAKAFFAAPTAAVLAYAQNFPDGLCGGPLAHSLGAPLILTATGKESVAAAYSADTAICDGFVLGGTGLISDASANRIFGRDPKAPIPLR